MTKSKCIALASIAASMVCLIVVSSAIAAAEYLWNGAQIAAGAKLSTDSVVVGTTLFLLEDMKPPGGAVDILCSALFVGEITGPENRVITEVLDLAGIFQIPCTYVTKGACEGTETTMEAIHLPWLFTPLLANLLGIMAEDVAGTGKGQPGYAVKCKTIIGTLTDECSGEIGAEVRNSSEGFESEFLESNEEITPAVECSLSKEKSGLWEGIFSTIDTGGGALAISN